MGYQHLADADGIGRQSLRATALVVLGTVAF
jgi:hypothetical protein